MPFLYLFLLRSKQFKIAVLHMVQLFLFLICIYFKKNNSSEYTFFWSLLNCLSYICKKAEIWAATAEQIILNKCLTWLISSICKMSIGKSLFPHVNSAFRFAQQFFTWLIEWVTGNCSKYLYVVQYSAWLAIKKLFLVSKYFIVPPYQTFLCGLYTKISEELAILYILILYKLKYYLFFSLFYIIYEELHIESQAF